MLKATKLFLAVCVCLSGCLPYTTDNISSEHQSDIQLQKATNYKVGGPYNIKGVRYYPRVNYKYKEKGLASWYGKGFHKKKTANGDIFDQNALTAAHRTLPMPSIVRVTNLRNKKTIIVKVNDRGPYIKGSGRIIDLSRKSADLLGFLEQGVTPVQVEILPYESRILAGDIHFSGSKTVQAGLTGTPSPILTPSQDPTPAISLSEEPKTSAGLYIQAGAFKNENNAHNHARALSDSTDHTFVVKIAVTNGKTHHRVICGPLATTQLADELIETIKIQGKGPARIRIGL